MTRAYAIHSGILAGVAIGLYLWPWLLGALP